MRVQEISGKDVHNMKARSFIKRGPASSQQIQHFRGGTGVQGVQGCLGGLRGLPGGWGVQVLGGGAVWLGSRAGSSSRTNGSGYPLSVPAEECSTRYARADLDGQYSSMRHYI